jgi:hypothetical protein
MFEYPGAYECERKFLLEADRAQRFWSIAAAHLSCREQPGIPNFVRTTYFDTDDLACHQSSRGPVHRRLRVREYGPMVDSEDHSCGWPVDRCYIELKQSFDGMRHKVRVAVPPAEAAARIAALAGAPVTPCVTTWYRRRAFVDPDTRLRVTLDDSVLFCRPWLLGRATFDVDPSDVIARGPSFILELKYADEAPEWVHEAIEGLEEAVGFSKFMLGMTALEDDLASRRYTTEQVRQSCSG